MIRAIRVTLPIALLTVLAAVAHADVATLAPIHDNTLYEDAEGDTSNGSGPGIFCGRNSQGVTRRAVLAFDLTGAVPDGAQVDSVRLELHMNNSSDTNPRDLSLHRVTADWGEGASSTNGGAGAPAQANDATWLHTFYPGSFWASPGGDFVAAPSATTNVLAAGDYAWQSAELAQDVRDWIAGNAANYGWILVGDESAVNTARRFDSRESANVAQRPRLLIFYDVSTPVLPSTWGRLKARFR